MSGFDDEYGFTVMGGLPRVSAIQRALQGELRATPGPAYIEPPVTPKLDSAPPKVPNALDTQVGGSHYKTMPVQPMEFSMANGMDACQHTIIKYVSRFRSKGGLVDLEKAKHVIDMLIEFEKRREQRA